MQRESLKSTGQVSIENATFAAAEVTTLSASTLSAAVSHAKTFRMPDSGQVLMANEADCFLKPFAWFDNSNRELLCWRTWQRCLLEDWTEFSGRWPRSGLMRSGIAYRQPPLVRRILANGFSFWPTPTATDGRRARLKLESLQKKLPSQKQDLAIWARTGKLVGNHSGRMRMLPESNAWRMAHGIPESMDRLRGLGNAVVPQVAEWIGSQVVESLK